MQRGLWGLFLHMSSRKAWKTAELDRELHSPWVEANIHSGGAQAAVPIEFSLVGSDPILFPSSSTVGEPWLQTRSIGCSPVCT